MNLRREASFGKRIKSQNHAIVAIGKPEIDECPFESAWVAVESVVEIGIVGSLEEIQTAVEGLPSPEQEVLFRFLAARLGAENPPLHRPYRTRTQPGRVRPDIDADKIGQLAEDL